MRYQESIEADPPRSGVDEGRQVGAVSYALLLGIGMLFAGLSV